MWDTSELVEPALPFGGVPRRAVHPFFSPHLFTGEHLLEIDSLNSAAGVTLTIAGEVLTEGLALIPFVFTHVPNTNRTIATTRVSVPGGWLARLRVSASAGAPIQGQCFVWIRAALGQGGAVLTIGDITSGYLTANTPLAWPGPHPHTPLDGAGAVRSITGSTPAAGGGVSEKGHTR